MRSTEDRSKASRGEGNACVASHKMNGSLSGIEGWKEHCSQGEYLGEVRII